MKPLSTTIPEGWPAEAWVDYLRTHAHRSDKYFPEVAAWYRAGADAVERAKREKELPFAEQIKLLDPSGDVSPEVQTLLKPQRAKKDIGDFVVDAVRREG